MKEDKVSKEKISHEEVLHIAKLVKLNLSEKEVEALSEMLSETVDYIKVLEELDTSEVMETYQVTGLTNVFQKENEKKTTLTQKEALANAHEEVDGYFATEAVFNR